MREKESEQWSGIKGLIVSWIVVESWGDKVGKVACKWRGGCGVLRCCSEVEVRRWRG